MKAILKTKCGCTRMIDLADKADRVFVPLDYPYGRFYASPEDAERDLVKSRSFKIRARGFEAIGGAPFEVALFEEE